MYITGQDIVLTVGEIPSRPAAFYIQVNGDAETLTDVTIEAINDDGTLFSRAGVIHDAAGGEVWLVFEDGDTDTVGTWRIYVQNEHDTDEHDEWPTASICKLTVKER